MSNYIAPGSIFRQSNPYENIIQELLWVDGKKNRQLQNQEQILQTKKSAISNIGSKLTDLNSLLSTFADPFSQKLKPLSAQSSNKEAISVLSTNGLEDPGSYNISVSQLAKNDIVLSSSMAADGNTLSTSGNASFTIDVGGKSASITVNTSNLTNREVMDAIAEQINNKLDGKLQASAFNLGNGETQLSFKSEQTGEQDYISISNVQGDAAGLNLHNIFSKSSLNAKFKIDGVSFERSSNIVDDAVQGLKVKLKQITSQSEKIIIANDTDQARKNIKAFIDKFNGVNSIIREKTFLNGKSGNHGPLQDMRGIRELSYSLRMDTALPIQSMADQPIQDLADIGIELKQDGTMYIADSDKLESALKTSPKNVEQLFTADDGLINRLQSTIDGVIKGDSNMFDAIKNGIGNKLDRLDDRIATQNDYLANQEEELRARFSKLRLLKSQSQRQLTRLSMFRNALGM